MSANQDSRPPDDERPNENDEDPVERQQRRSPRDRQIRTPRRDR